MVYAPPLPGDAVGPRADDLHEWGFAATAVIAA